MVCMDLPVSPPILPMLAARVSELPVDGTWIFEPKWDGFPELLQPLESQLPVRCVLDGEIVVAKHGGLDFEALQLRIHPAASRVKLLSQQTPASIVFFDLLCDGDRDWRSEPFERRREKLESLLASAMAPIHLTPATREPAVASDWFRRFEGAGLDGVIAKPI